MTPIGISLGFISGCAIGLFALSFYPSGLDAGYGWALIGLALVTALPIWLAWHERRVRLACLFLAFMLAGCGRALLIHPPIDTSDLAFYNGDERSPKVSVTGVISSEPVLTDRSQRVRIKSEEIVPAGKTSTLPVSGDMLITLPRYPAFTAGERLAISGTLTTPPNFSGFDYRAYLARIGVLSYMTFPRVRSLGPGDASWLDEPGLFIGGVRRTVSRALQRSLSEPQAALAVGVVTGDRSTIPEDVQTAFNRSGTTHILAVSGQNISLLLGAIWLFYSRGNVKRRMPVGVFILLLVILGAYTLFTGATPSVLRAALMGVLLLMGPVVGRRYDPTTAVVLSATWMTMLDPDVLADGGFQLSFMATMGITYIAPHFYTLLGLLPMPTLLKVPIAASFGAQAAVVPLAALLTRQVSFVSLPATLTAEVSLLPLMVSGMAAGILGSIFRPLGELVGLLVWPFAFWLLWWVELWGSLPWASVELESVNSSLVALYYVALGGALWLITTIGRMRVKPGKVVLGLGAAAYLALLTLAFIFLNP